MVYANSRSPAKVSAALIGVDAKFQPVAGQLSNDSGADQLGVTPSIFR